MTTRPTTFVEIRAALAAADVINPALLAETQAITERTKALAQAPLLPYRDEAWYQAHVENFMRYAAEIECGK